MSKLAVGRHVTLTYLRLWVFNGDSSFLLISCKFTALILRLSRCKESHFCSNLLSLKIDESGKLGSVSEVSHDLGADRKNPQTGNKIFTFSLFCVQSSKCKLKVRATFKVSRVAPTCKNHSTLKVRKSWHGASFQPLFLWSCYLNYPVYTNSVFPVVVSH